MSDLDDFIKMIPSNNLLDMPKVAEGSQKLKYSINKLENTKKELNLNKNRENIQKVSYDNSDDLPKVPEVTNGVFRKLQTPAAPHPGYSISEDQRDGNIQALLGTAVKKTKSNKQLKITNEQLRNIRISFFDKKEHIGSLAQAPDSARNHAQAPDF